MGLRNVFQWWYQTVTDLPINARNDGLMAGLTSGLIEPFESTPKPGAIEFHRSSNKPQITRKYSSLLTKAIKSYNSDTCGMDSAESRFKNSDTARSRSITSTCPDLTSDGGTTNSSRSQTPNPSLDECPQQTTYSSIENLATRPVVIKVYPASRRVIGENKVQAEGRSVIAEISTGSSESTLPNLESQQSSSLRKHSISFKFNEANSATSEHRARAKSHPNLTSDPITFNLESKAEDGAAQRIRKPTIKFVCSGPQPGKVPIRSDTSSAPLTSSGFSSARSSLGITSTLIKKMTEPISKDNSIRSASRPSSPYSNFSGHEPPGLSQATRFYEFASEEAEVDDWVHQDLGFLTSKLTINDTLKKENEIRRLASEVEEEEAEEAEDSGNNSEGEIEEGEEVEEEEEEDDDDDFDFEFDSLKMGTESDSEADFADSDESDDEIETTFWAPRRGVGDGFQIPDTNISNVTSAHSSSGYNSSIDFTPHLRSSTRCGRGRRLSKSIGPETSDLPDSTDFVCGTLDEDRPIEEAYLSSLRAQKNAKHKSIPQDIDPSFPTSDNDNQKDDKRAIANSTKRQRRPSSGKSELNNGRLSRTLSTNRGSISCYSPKKLHSPPPPKHRLRSPTQKIFSKSPKRLFPTKTSAVMGTAINKDVPPVCARNFGNA